VKGSRRALALAIVVVASPAPAAQAARSSLPVVGSGARPGPDLLYADPPAAPQLENTGPWKAKPILVSGATSYRDGEFVYQDFLFDDHGATGTEDPNDPFNQVENMFSPKHGTLSYPTDPVYAYNAADLVELRVKPLSGAIAIRVTLNTLEDSEKTAFTVAVGGSDAARPWPHQAGVSSPAALFLTVHGATAELLDAATGKAVAPAPTAAVDTTRRQIDVRIPRDAWDPGTATVRMAAGVGLWDAAAKRYLTPAPSATATTPGGAAPGNAALFNMAFRTQEPVPHIYDPANGNTIVEGHAGVVLDGAYWRERQQGDVLANGDVTPFAAAVDFGKLLEHRADDSGVPKSGHIDRIFPSRFVFGQGVDYDQKCILSSGPECSGRYVGQLQPYALYVPRKPAPAAGYGLVVSMHGLSANYNEFLGSHEAEQLGERGGGSIVASPEGRGPDGSYESYAEADVFEMWNDVARHYDLDPDLTDVTGYSMGGGGTYRLASRWPDLWARAFPIVGPPTSADSFKSLRNVPVMAWYAQTDELVGPEMSEEAFLNAQQAGIRYDHWVFTPAGHITLGNNDEFGPAAAFLGDHRVERDPAHVTYVVDPSQNPKAQSPADHAYWLSGLATRGSGTGTIDVRSAGFGAGDPPVLPLAVSAGTLEGGSHGPLPYHRRTLDWGPAPATAKANRVEVDAANIGAVTIDAPRARVGCDAEVAVTTDGPAKVALAGCDITTRVKKGTSRLRCLRKRSLVVHVPRRLRHRRVRSARITVNGRRASTARRPKLARRISFKGVKRRRVTVRIVARLAGGKRVVLVRHYRLCTSKRR
jgi:hypothetical protein